MDVLKSALSYLAPTLPLAFSLVLVISGLFLARRVLERRISPGRKQSLTRQLILLGLTFLGLLVVILASPLSDAQKGQLLSLIGLLLSAAIALSATTILGNGLAGVMLKLVRNFRVGDFVGSGEHFGRVTERGLFHTEIQTIDRSLLTVPNLYLVTHPVRVIRSSGTIISATVSLGYDVPRGIVEKQLIEASLAAELEDPYVQILELGDFSVTYKAAGLLEDVKQMISRQSRLKEMMLDKLHEANIEIVSPMFRNSRDIPKDVRFIPPAPKVEVIPDVQVSAESVVFDKADEAENEDQLETRLEKIIAQIEDLKKLIKNAADETQKERLETEQERLEKFKEQIQERLDGDD